MGHGTAEAIGVGIREAGELVGDLEDLLLEQQDAFALAQDGAEHRMGGPEVIGWTAFPRRLHRVALRYLLGGAALDVGADEAADNRPWAKEGGLHDHVVEGLRLRLGEQMPLAGRLDLEDSQRLPSANEVHGRGIGRMGGQRIHIEWGAGGFFDEGERLLDSAERA